MLRNFGMDLSLEMSKAFWFHSLSWILDWKCGRIFGQKVSVGSQLWYLDRLLLGDCENASCSDRLTSFGGELER